MLASMSSISQTVTPKNKEQRLSKVEIDTSIARKIAKDLVSGDVCKDEMKLVLDNLELTNKKVVLKDSIITTLNKQKEALNLIISKKDEMYAKQEIISATFKEDLSKQKNTTLVYKLLSVLGVVSTLLLLVK